MYFKFLENCRKALAKLFFIFQNFKLKKLKFYFIKNLKKYFLIKIYALYLIFEIFSNYVHKIIFNNNF